MVLEIAKIIGPAIISFLFGLWIRRLEPRVKLVFFSQPSFHFLLERDGGEPLIVNTFSIILRNNGTRKAENVEIVHAFAPARLQMIPPHHSEATSIQNGNHLLRISSLAPKETVNIQMLSYGQVPMLLALRSDAGEAKYDQHVLSRQPKRSVQIILIAAQVVGAFSLFYWMVVLGKWIYQNYFV